MSTQRILELPMQGSKLRHLLKQSVPLMGNSNIAEHLTREDIDDIRYNVEILVGHVLNELLIDWRNDPNMAGTPERYARMLVEEAYSGRYQKPPSCTVFPNTADLDEMYTTGPITVNSSCSHHLVPIVGRAWVGVIPGDHVLGLSKFNRLVQWICRRPQIQEEMVVQMADTLERHLGSPRGLAVVVEASHLCMTWRGVEEAPSAVMRTSVVRGRFREDPAARAEFFTAIK